MQTLIPQSAAIELYPHAPQLLTAGSGAKPPGETRTALASDEQPEHDRAPLSEDERIALDGIEKNLMEHNLDNIVETKND